MAEILISECWRVVEGFPHFEVSNLGNARRLTDKGVVPVKLWVDGKGYLQLFVGLDENGKKIRFSMNRLICRMFNGPPPTDRHQAAYNDGSKTNNSAANLRWATVSENQMDRVKHRTSNRGSEHGMSKLKEHQIFQIRHRHSELRNYRAVAREFDISPGYVESIVKRRAWAWLSDNPT